MPIDFKALMALSPEERAANAERSRQEFEQAMKDRIAKRQDQIGHIGRAIESDASVFSQWDLDFVRDLSRKAAQRDISGYEGGYLMDLTTSQVSQIERITKITDKLIGSSPAASTEPQEESSPPSNPAPRKGFRPR